MKNLRIKLYFSFLILAIISIVNTKNTYATSFNFDISKGIDLYQVPYYYVDYGITVPSTYPTSFQITTDKDCNIRYENLEQDRGYTVTDNGLIELKVYTSYFYSDPLKLKITVENDPYLTSDDEEYITTVNIKDYSQIYANIVLDEYIKNNITSDMTDYQIAQKACEFVCQYPYGYSSGSAASLIIYGYGDCFASCDVIEYIFNKFNIKCQSRAAFQVTGSGNHNNIAAILDGRLMEVDAGYNVKTNPRTYTIREIANNGVEVKSGIVKLYSGLDTQVVVPATFGTYGTGTVTEIGEKAFSFSNKEITSITLPNTITTIGKEAFNGQKNLTYLNIPASVTTIEPTAFIGCDSLTSIDIDSNNPNFSYEDGIIYNKDKTKIIASLPGVVKGNLTFKSSVSEIGKGAFSYNTNITSVTFGSNIKKIGADAFVYTNLKGVTIPNTVTEIGNYAFSTAKLSTVVIEKGSNITIGNSAFTNNSQALIYVPSTIENNLDNIASTAKSNFNTLMVENNSQILNIAKNTSTKYEIIDYASKIALKDIMVISPSSTNIPEYDYTGNPINPEIKIQYGSYILKEGTDYIVKHSNNIDAGTDTITLEGIGNYTGTITRKMYINRLDVDIKVTYDKTVYAGNTYDITIDSPVATKSQSITYYDSNYNKLNSKPIANGTYYFSVFATFNSSNYNNYRELYKYEIKDKPTYLKGDLDRNNVIDANDASIALEIFKAENATAEDILIGDMDDNKLIDANDASLILELYKTNN